MNSPTFVEASRALAEQIMKEKRDADSSERIANAFQRLLSRAPMPHELEALQAFYHQQLAVSDQDVIKSLFTIGESPVDASLPPAELAVYTILSNVLVNLDEVLTRN